MAEFRAAESIQLDNEAKNDPTRARASEGSFLFPAPASAFQPHVAAATPAPLGIWAFVAENTLVVAQPFPHPRKWLSFTLLDGSGWSKYTSVSLCQELDRDDWPIPDSPLVTASESGVVRIWNIEKSSTVKYHEQHWGRQTIAEWSPRNSSLIYAMDIKGHVSIWNLKQNSLTNVSFGKIRATCIAVSPHEDDVMAVGTVGGDVYILDTSGVGAIMHQMQHAEQICSVSWKPTGVWPTVPPLRKFTEPYLVSSTFSLEPPSIIIWDRRGKEVAKLIPWEFDTKARKLIKTYIPSIWVTHPVTQQIGLVSRGAEGDVVVWHEENNYVPQKLHDLNPNYVITGFLQSGAILWTFTKERVVIGWNLVTEQFENIIPMFNGISSIQMCPTEPLVALGGLDGMLRVVKMGAEYPEQEVKELKLPVVSTQIKGRITALAWHPRTEKIAFGTAEGQLGILDIKREKDIRFTMIFDRKVPGTVYTVDWGAHTYPEGFLLREKKEGENSDRTDNLWIYACGNRSVYMIHPSRKSNPLVPIMKTIQMSNPGKSGCHERQGYGVGVTDIKWSPDQVYCAIGYRDGKIEIYQAPYLKLRCWIKCHSTDIQFLAWRPHDFQQELDSPAKHVWFASGSNDATAKIFDLAMLYDPDFLKDTSAEPGVIRRISSDGILIGHGGLRVISLAWSPHDDNLLLSTSYDRTAVVWDISTRTRIARYIGHEHRLVAGIFHPIDRFKVITSSDEMTQDSCLHIWDYRKHPESEDYNKGKGFESMSGEVVEAVKAQAAPVALLLPGNFGDVLSTPEDMPDDISSIEEIVAEENLITKLAKSCTLFPLANPTVERNTFLDELKFIIDKTPIPAHLSEHAKQQLAEENSVPKVVDDELSYLVKLLESNNTTASASKELLDDPVLHLAVLGSGSDVQRMLQMQVEHYVRMEEWGNLTNLIGYVEDPKSIIEALIQAKNINGQSLLYAHKYSKRLFEKSALAYCDQLTQSDSDSCQEVCSLLLQLDKVDDALETLVKNKLFPDAIILAKSRDLPTSIVQEILDKWIQFSREEREKDDSEGVLNMSNALASDADPLELAEASTTVGPDSYFTEDFST